MNCKRCGAEIIGEQKFCGNCGEPVIYPANTGYAQQTPPPQQPYTGVNSAQQVPPQQVPPQQPYMGANNARQMPPQQPYVGGYANNPQQPYNANVGNTWNPNPAFSEKPRKPKSSKKPVVIVAILAIIALVAALAVILVPIVKKAFMSEQERFAMYDREVVEDALEALADATEEAKGDAKYSGSVEVNLSDSMKKQLGAYIGDVSSAKITIDAANDGNKGGCKIGVLLGATELVTLDVVFDIDNGKIYVEAPGLVDGALELDLGELMPDTTALSMLTETTASIEISDAVIKDVLKLIDVTYGATYGMVESKGTLEVDGVSQKCTVYTLEINEEMARKMVLAFLEQLKKSNNIKDLACDIAENYFAEHGMTRAEIISEIDAFCDEGITAMTEEYEPSDSDEVITYTLYVDGDDAIGRALEFNDMQIKLVRAKNGKDVAFEYSVLTVYGGLEDGAKLTGRGKEDKSGFTGNASIYVQDYEIVNLTFDKFKSDDDTLSGSVEISFGADIGEIDVDYEVAAILETVKLTLNFDVTSDKGKIGIGISAMNLDLGEIVIEGTEDSKYAPKIPDDVSYSDIDTFGENINVYELISRLTEAGLDISGLMGGY